MKKFQIQGFALFIVLIFMQLLAILGLYGLENSVLETKMSHHDWEKYDIETSAKRIMREVKIKLHEESLPSCVMRFQASNVFMHQSVFWWDSVGCTADIQDVQSVHYSYVIMLMGKNMSGSLKYFRVILFVKNKSSQLILEENEQT